MQCSPGQLQPPALAVRCNMVQPHATTAAYRPTGHRCRHHLSQRMRPDDVEGALLGLLEEFRTARAAADQQQAEAANGEDAVSAAGGSGRDSYYTEAHLMDDHGHERVGMADGCLVLVLMQQRWRRLGTVCRGVFTVVGMAALALCGAVLPYCAPLLAACLPCLPVWCSPRHLAPPCHPAPPAPTNECSAGVHTPQR